MCWHIEYFLSFLKKFVNKHYYCYLLSNLPILAKIYNCIDGKYFSFLHEKEQYLIIQCYFDYPCRTIYLDNSHMDSVESYEILVYRVKKDKQFIIPSRPLRMLYLVAVCIQIFTVKEALNQKKSSIFFFFKDSPIYAQL